MNKAKQTALSASHSPLAGMPSADSCWWTCWTRQERWSCRLLGARTPPIALTTAVRANRAVAVVIASHLASARQRAVGSLQAADDMGVAVFYAGNAFATPRSRVKVPGCYLGSRVEDACHLIVTTLESRVR